MVTLAKPTQTNTDTLARVYIQALARGEKPSDRPVDFGKWEQTIQGIEHVYDKSHGDVSKIELILYALSTHAQSSRDKELADLLAPVQLTVEEIAAEEEQVPSYPPLPQSAYLPPELSRGACPWLDEYVAFSKKWSPRGYADYHEAVGLSLLSAVAGHRVSFAYGQMEYTPLYIALVGFTTLFKKTTTARLYYGLLHAAGLDWMLGANISTPQKLLSDMAGKTIPGNYDTMSILDQERERKRLAMCGQRGWYYDEFGLHLDQMVRENGTMSDFKGLLRIMDDCMPVFENATVARGRERIEKPYLSLLASLTPEDIKPHAAKDNKFWRDGLFARFAFVCPPRQTKSSRERFPKGENNVSQHSGKASSGMERVVDRA